MIIVPMVTVNNGKNGSITQLVVFAFLSYYHPPTKLLEGNIYRPQGKIMFLPGGDPPHSNGDPPEWRLPSWTETALDRDPLLDKDRRGQRPPERTWGQTKSGITSHVSVILFSGGWGEGFPCDHHP